MEITKKMRCCKTCGHVTFYPRTRKYECLKLETDPFGICDRWQEDVLSPTIMKRIDAKIKELEKCEDGQYQLTKRPPLRQNYRVQELKEIKSK